MFAGGEEAGEVAVARRRERERRRAEGGGAAGKPACFFSVFLVRCVWSVVSFFWRAAETRIAERRRPGGEDTGEEESRGRGLEVEGKKKQQNEFRIFPPSVCSLSSPFSSNDTFSITHLYSNEMPSSSRSEARAKRAPGRRGIVASKSCWSAGRVLPLASTMEKKMRSRRTSGQPPRRSSRCRGAWLGGARESPALTGTSRQTG